MTISPTENMNSNVKKKNGFMGDVASPVVGALEEDLKKTLSK